MWLIKGHSEILKSVLETIATYHIFLSASGALQESLATNETYSKIILFFWGYGNAAASLLKCILLTSMQLHKRSPELPKFSFKKFFHATLGPHISKFQCGSHRTLREANFNIGVTFNKRKENIKRILKKNS